MFVRATINITLVENVTIIINIKDGTKSINMQ